MTDHPERRSLQCPSVRSAPIGAPIWIDLFTSDPDKSRAFYGELLGWTAEEPNQDFGGYFNFSKDGSLVAGGMRNDGTAGVPDCWNVYLAVENAEATVAAATAHGGGVIVPAMESADLGSMAVITDAGGAAIGMWQPGTHKGIGLFGEPGAPAWFELHTRDYAASVQFYTDVFGWDAKTMSDTPEFRYTTLGEGDDARPGSWTRPASCPRGVRPLGRLPPGGRHRRRREDRRGTRRVARHAGRGHALRPHRHGRRPHREPLPARRLTLLLRFGQRPSQPGGR